VDTSVSSEGSDESQNASDFILRRILTQPDGVSDPNSPNTNPMQSRILGVGNDGLQQRCLTGYNSRRHRGLTVFNFGREMDQIREQHERMLEEVRRRSGQSPYDEGGEQLIPPGWDLTDVPSLDNTVDVDSIVNNHGSGTRSERDMNSDSGDDNGILVPGHGHGYDRTYENELEIASDLNENPNPIENPDSSSSPEVMCGI
jgi:hypothetical protein